MKRVLKYEFEIGDDYFVIDVPPKSKVLKIAQQDKQIKDSLVSIWFLVDEDEGRVGLLSMVARTFRLAGTGHPIHDNHCKNYIDTFTSNNGMFVWHVFEMEQKYD